MSNSTYDNIKAFLTVWLFPVMVILGGAGTLLAAFGIANAPVVTAALVTFFGVLGQAFSVQVKKANEEYFGAIADPEIEGTKGLEE